MTTPGTDEDKVLRMTRRFALSGPASATAFGLLLACGGDAIPDAPDSRAEAPADSPAVEAETGMRVDPALLPEGVTEAMVQEGREIFNGPGICYTCHTQGGGGGPLAPDLTDDVWLNVDGEYLSIIELVNTGVVQPLEHPGAMLPRAGMPLTDDQVAAVASYAYMLSRMEVR